MKVVVFGVTGVVGLSAARHFSTIEGVSVIGVSRRRPLLPGAEHVRLDLSDQQECAAVLGSNRFAGVTHVVYASLHESSDLRAGWSDPALMQHNLHLFENALDPLARVHGVSLEHVSLLQGAKAYGLHLGRTPLPAKERDPRDLHANFYFMQEDALKVRAAAAGWSWTIFRPQVVYGESFGSPMNLLPAIGVYASVERARGRRLSFPGGPPSVQEAVDARLLGRALAWAATTPAARNEVFNLTNGDVFCWDRMWPTIAEMFGMEVGEARPARLAEVMPARAEEWAAVVKDHNLVAPADMASFVGGSWAYADILFGSAGSRPLPAMLSTIKIRQAGFHDCVDTEDMFKQWFSALQARRLLPL